MSTSASPYENQNRYNQFRGRFLLVGLVLLFALPAIIAKLILSQSWYESGVTNRGELIEPRITYSMLGVEAPEEKNWHLGYVMPEVCESLCRQQLHLLRQTYLALGKYQGRVTPVVYLSANMSPDGLQGLIVVRVNQAFLERIRSSDYLISDPLGQLVMRYRGESDTTRLVPQNKGLLADFRKLLKLSRVG